MGIKYTLKPLDSKQLDLHCRGLCAKNNKKKIKTIFLFDLAINNLWGRRCAIRDLLDYSHSPKVKKLPKS